ncbi:MAG: hypothetical protein CO118_04225 [Flavobacteriales bacterium CG_4_9_14_3_um_filter_32_8]|nr:MAG: hypothetical protein CO118_04225 [Flavobacteriales bacterium CG_4_9_14_3_um_filter_32_8]
MKKLINYLAFIFILSSQMLQAQNNKGNFYSLEKAFESPEEVKILKLNNPAIKELPMNISSLVNLEELDLTKSGVVEFKSVIKLPNLKVLKLDGQKGLKLQELLIAINSSKSLEELHVSNCMLNYLPHEIGNFVNLKNIDISNNKLRNLPYEIEFLSQLKRLDVSNNNLVEINNKIINCSHLSDFNIANNDSLKQKDVFITLSYLNNLQTLTIGGLKFLDLEVLNLQNIQHLKIVSSNLTSLPQESIKLNQLQRLSIVNSNVYNLLSLFAENNIQVLEIENGIFSNGLEQITSLREIMIDNCRISPSFYEIAQLEKLSTINIKNCSNLNVDELFAQLNKNIINDISIIACGMENIPSSISSLKELKRLNFTRNSIQKIPEELASLKKLQSFIIKNNIINPQEIANLQKSNDQLAIYWDFYDDFIVDNKEVTESTKTIKTITPPISGIDVPKKDFIVSTKEKTLLQMESGTTLDIPANAFVDEDGNVIEGEVDVVFREFIDPIDFLVSGIPMSYDSAGVSYTFSSAGQIEFRASVNGKEVYPNPDNLIQVNMRSYNNDPAMNMYAFNEKLGNWEIKDADTINDPNDSKRLSQLMDSTAMNSYFPFSMSQPPPIYYDLVNYKIKKDNKLKSFQLTFDKLPVSYDSKDARKNFAQLNTLRQYTWIYDGDEVNQTFHEMDSLADFLKNAYNRYKVKRLLSSDAKYYEKNCPTFIRNIALEPNADDDNYLLTMVMFDDTIILPVYPHVNSTYPETEQRRNKQVYKGYNNALKRNTKNWARADKKYTKLLAEYEANLRTTNRYTEENRRSLESEILVSRSFALMSFGVYNCDQIRQMEQPVRLLAKLIDEEDNTIDPFTVYVIDKSNTSVMQFQGQNKAYYDASANNAIMLVLKDDKVGLIDAKSFSTAMKNGEKEIKIKTFSNKDVTIGQLKSFL